VLGDVNERRLSAPQGDVEVPDANLQGVAQWRSAEHFDLGATDEAHFE
jgi:hypothetical protein